MARRRLTGSGASSTPAPTPDPALGGPPHVEPVAGSTRAAVVQHGAGWVAAIAAVAGVIITAIVSFTGGQGQAAPGAVPTPSAAVAQASRAASDAPAISPASTPATSTSGHTPLPASVGPLGPVLADAASGADIVATISAPELPEAAPHTLVSFGPADGLSFEAPDAWAAGGMGTPWLYGSPRRSTGTAAVAAPSERAFYDTLASSGVFVGGSPDMTVPIAPLVEQLNGKYWRNCTVGGRGAYDDGMYAGLYEVYGPCGEDAIRIVSLVARDEATNRTIGVDLHLTTRADLEAAARIIDSVRYEPASGGEQVIP